MCESYKFAQNGQFFNSARRKTLLDENGDVRFQRKSCECAFSVGAVCVCVRICIFIFRKWNNCVSFGSGRLSVGLISCGGVSVELLPTIMLTLMYLNVGRKLLFVWPNLSLGLRKRVLDV